MQFVESSHSVFSPVVPLAQCRLLPLPQRNNSLDLD